MVFKLITSNKIFQEMRYSLNSMSENLLGGEEYFLSPNNFLKNNMEQ